MPNVDQAVRDLAFIRAVVSQREGQRPNLFGVYAAWAVYIVVGYTLLDVNPRWANVVLGVGWIPAALAAYVARQRTIARGDISDPVMAKKAGLHFGVGIALAIAASLGLAAIVPGLRGPVSGQLIVCMIGLVYFLAGIHFDARFLWLGPVMIVGGLLIGFMPVLPWTTLGIVIALGLLVPSFVVRSRGDGVSDSAVSHVES